MNHRHFYPAAGLCVLMLSGPAWAQVARTPGAAQPVASEPTRSEPTPHTGSKVLAAHDIPLMIERALHLAIEGSALELAARQFVVNDAGQLEKKKDAVSLARELQGSARRKVEEARKMVSDAEGMIRQRSEHRSSKRLCDATTRYIQTLNQLSGETLAKTTQHESRPEKRSSTAAGSALSDEDIVSITLINDAVREAINACFLRKMISPADQGSTASEQLRRHARQMAAQSQRRLENLEGASPTPGDKNRASVALLARQARDIVNLLQDDAEETVPESETRGR